MRKSEWNKLKVMLENGEPKESILDRLEPKRNNDGQKSTTPEGGISIRGAARKFGVAHQTMARWVQRGLIRILLTTRNEKYIDEEEARIAAQRYKEGPGRGKRTILNKN